MLGKFDPFYSQNSLKKRILKLNSVAATERTLGKEATERIFLEVLEFMW